jgi:hypothetical protein
MTGTFPKAIQAKGQIEVQLAAINLVRLMKFRVKEVGTTALTFSC